MEYFELIAPLLFRLPPEFAHRLVVRALAMGLVPPQPRCELPQLAMKISGLHFAHPVGLAAGFDKNGEAVVPLFNQGFAFVECGSVTPQPQKGNPKPRLFRLTDDEAVINRMGFNNDGLAALRERLSHQVTGLRAARERGQMLGINIGKNKDTADAGDDYVKMLVGVGSEADYITLNISSPNTPGLRDLQTGSALESLLDRVCSTREKLFKRTPLWLKLAPDLTDEQCAAIVETVRAFPLGALVISNTTLNRPDTLCDRRKTEEGGLSGKPLMALSTERLRLFYQLTGGQIPLVGVGGVSSAEDAYAKVRAGASLVQLYSALVYQGFGLVTRIRKGLAEYLERDGYATLAEAVGADVKGRMP